MATVKRHSVIIKNYLNIFEEFVASAAITPGHLVELMSTGEIRVHATAGGNVLPMFAMEDELQGNDIDDAYADGDVVKVWIPQRGDIVNAILADGQNISIGDFLESTNDGTLTKHVADSGAGANLGNQIIGQAIEAVNLAASPHPVSGLRLKIRIM